MKLFSLGLAFALSLPSLLFAAPESANSVIVDSRDVMNDDEYKPHVGLLSGLAVPEGSYSNNVEYGVNIGFQPYIPYSLGAEISTNNNISDSPMGTDFHRTKLLAIMNYNFGGTIPVIAQSYVGFGLGPMIETVGSSNEVVIGFMPQVGFDYPVPKLIDGMSLGLNARYMISSSGLANAFSMNAMAKYWF